MLERPEGSCKIKFTAEDMERLRIRTWEKESSKLSISYSSAGYVECYGQKVYPKKDLPAFANRMANLQQDLLNGNLSSVKTGLETPIFLNHDYLKSEDIKIVHNIIEDWIFFCMQYADPVKQEQLKSINAGIKAYVEGLLQKEQASDSINKAPSDIIKTSDHFSTFEISFENYLSDKGKMILPYLKSSYTNQPPKVIAYMLFALNDMSLISESVFKNVSQLHKVLKQTMGDVGTRQALQKHISKLLPKIESNSLFIHATASSYDHEQINIHRSAIKAQFAKF